MHICTCHFHQRGLGYTVQHTLWSKAEFKHTNPCWIQREMEFEHDLTACLSAPLPEDECAGEAEEEGSSLPVRRHRAEDCKGALTSFIIWSLGSLWLQAAAVETGSVNYLMLSKMEPDGEVITGSEWVGSWATLLWWWACFFFFFFSWWTGCLLCMLWIVASDKKHWWWIEALSEWPTWRLWTRRPLGFFFKNKPSWGSRVSKSY